MTGRAGYILWENREVIDQMMQQMDDFAAQNGGYINRSGVGNFRTSKTVDEEDKKEMSMKRKAARAAGVGAVGAGAIHKVSKDPGSIRRGAQAAKEMAGSAKDYYKGKLGM